MGCPRWWDGSSPTSGDVHAQHGRAWHGTAWHGTARPQKRQAEGTIPAALSINPPQQEKHCLGGKCCRCEQSKVTSEKEQGDGVRSERGRGQPSPAPPPQNPSRTSLKGQIKARCLRSDLRDLRDGKAGQVLSEPGLGWQG